jgi:hypothetical protein
MRSTPLRAKTSLPSRVVAMLRTTPPPRVWALASPNAFLGVALAALRFADFPRLDLEALRTLPRAVGVPFLTIARFFRGAMIATSLHRNALPKQPRQAKAFELI